MERLAFSFSTTTWPAAGTPSKVRSWRSSTWRAPSSSLMRVMGFMWPLPRMGFLFSSSTSSRTVLAPSPITWAGMRRAAAMT